jgi:hypothetical protein
MSSGERVSSPSLPPTGTVQGQKVTVSLAPHLKLCSVHFTGGQWTDGDTVICYTAVESKLQRLLSHLSLTFALP